MSLTFRTLAYDIKFVLSRPDPISEPEVYALFLVGLSLIIAVARRKSFSKQLTQIR
jgi:hypothetical protein